MIKELLTSTKARMKRLQDRMYAAILDYVVSTITTKEDLITFSNSNIDAINKIDKILNKRLEKELTGYKRYLLKGIKTILSNVYTEYSAIDIRAIEIGNDVNDRILKHAAKNITQLTNITPIYDDIKKQAISLMSKYEGISLRELREAIKVKVEDKNIIQKYWSRFTYDIYSQYERIGANEIRKGLGLVFAVYEGGEIETTREFCEERSFNVYHISEIEGWVNLEWEGKPETGYNPIIDLGGYNCRHKLRWVSKEFAAAKRPEVRTLFAFEFNKAAPTPNIETPKPKVAPIPNTIENKKIVSLGFNKVFDNYINDHNTPELIKNVIDKLPKPNEIKNKGRHKGSYYLPLSKSIVSRDEGGSKTFFHEYGHHIDMGTGNKLRSVNEQFDISYKKDIENIKEVTEGKPFAYVIDIAKGKNEFRGLSDILDAFSGGMFHDNYFMPGHGKRYYKRKDQKNKEIYANMFEIISSNNQNVIREAQKLFPNLYDFVLNDLKNI